MTNAELKLAFNVYYDSIANFASPGYEDSEINVFLNKAMDIIVEQLVQAGRIEELAELITVEKYDLSHCTIEELGDYAYQTSVSDDFWFYLDSRLKIESRTAISVWATPQWIGTDLVNKLKVRTYAINSINSPIILRPKVAIYGKWYTTGSEEDIIENPPT